VEVKPGKEVEVAPERCNSVPGIRVDIERPESVEVWGVDTNGRQINFRCGGLLARAVQHEHDHLQGILFTDRMSTEVLASVRDHITHLEQETIAGLGKKGLLQSN
jgi:peptide deformylase